MRRLGMSVVFLVALASGCASKEEAAARWYGPGYPDPGDSVVLETSRGPIFSAYTELGIGLGLVGVPNIDDDDLNGEMDWLQAGQADRDNDFAVANLVTYGRTIELTLVGAGVRVHSDGEVLLDEINNVARVQSDVNLRVEFSEFLTQARLEVVDEAREDAFDVMLTASPLILNHHLQRAEETMALAISGGEGWDNTDFIDGYEAALEDGFFAIAGSRYDYDPWVQDEFEFGYATSPDAHLDVVFDTHRNGQGRPGEGLDDFPEDEYLAPDWAIVNWGRVTANSLDYGGNLEVSPPVTVDGVEYPYGRIYYGGASGYLPQQSTRKALDDMQIQKPFMGDSTWLCVGHIDEFTSTIPDSSAPKGFRFIIADTRSAWSLLDSLDEDMRLPRYAPGGWSGHSIDNVGEITGNRALRNLNEEVQEILDEEKARFVRELGLTEEDIIYMPSLFEEPQGCGQYVAALIPGMANLVVSEANGEPVILLADPFLREDVDDQSSDPMIDYVRSILPSSVEVVFLDDWDVYHMGLGEVHCASNVKREAPQTWWEDAGHLIGGDE